MKAKMKALVKDGATVAVETCAAPEIGRDDDVLVRVELAGLCRTDMYVAEGRIGAARRLILGHEFSGTVCDAGNDASDLKVGDRVTVNPLFACGECEQCKSGREMTCQHSKFLGVDRDGCFAGYSVVPLSSVYALPSDVSFAQAAYAEPVAASLAVLKTGIRPEERGLILGQNRFSQLMHRILAVKNFNCITVCGTADAGELPADSFDFVIETMVSSDTLEKMIRVVKPQGKIILKSRSYEPVTLKLREAIQKEPVIHIVNYGSFDDALSLLSSGSIAVEDLMDGTYKLESFREVLARARSTEALKPFFSPWDN